MFVKGIITDFRGIDSDYEVSGCPFTLSRGSETVPGKETAFRDALLQVVPWSRAETGCLNIHAYESLREPVSFAIHSEWVDEATFERHAQMPHTVRFVEAAKELLTHPIEGLRSRQIA